MGYRVAVVGATGNVGREMLNILAERQFPVDEVAAVASARSTGDIIDFGDSGQELKVKNLEHFDFSGWDMALFAAGSRHQQGPCSARRPGRLHGHRQQLVLSDGPGRPAHRAGSERRGDRGLHPEEHHREPELLDRAAGRRAEAAARLRQDQARRRRDLPVGVRSRESRAWTNCSSSPATSSSAIPTSR